MSQRLRWVIDIDIEKYFDSIPHSQLRDFLDQRVLAPATHRAERRHRERNHDVDLVRLLLLRDALCALALEQLSKQA
jgi:hypothetical protein